MKDEFVDGLLMDCARNSKGRSEVRRKGRSWQMWAGKRVIIIHFFWQLRDMAGEFGIYDAATVQRMQPAGFLWLDTLRSREGLTSLETPKDWL